MSWKVVKRQCLVLGTAFEVYTFCNGSLHVTVDETGGFIKKVSNCDGRHLKEDSIENPRVPGRLDKIAEDYYRG